MFDRRTFLKYAGATSAIVPLLHNTAFGKDNWPSRSISLVVPFAAGGTTDLVARLIADPLSGALGQRVIVENRAGGGGTIGADAVANANPDGYTLGIATVSTHAIAPTMMSRPPYDPSVDFTPIALVATAPLVILSHPSVPATSLAELKDHALAHPGTLNFGSPGVGSLGHLSGLWFSRIAAIQTTHIPYRGSAPALQDLLAGRIQFLIDNVPAALPHIRGGSIRALAVTSPGRVEKLPEVPSTAESGFPEVEILSWTMLLGPAGLPETVVRATNGALAAVLGQEANRRRLIDVNATPMGGTPDEAANFLKRELAKWTPLAKSSG